MLPPLQVTMGKCLTRLLKFLVQKSESGHASASISISYEIKYIHIYLCGSHQAPKNINERISK